MIYILAAIALAGLGFIAFMTGMFGVIYIIVWQPWVKVEAVSRPERATVGEAE